jgi:hypothetical protein
LSQKAGPNAGALSVIIHFVRTRLAYQLDFIDFSFSSEVLHLASSR